MTMGPTGPGLGLLSAAGFTWVTAAPLHQYSRFPSITKELRPLLARAHIGLF
jgi:hypothetical protein